MEVHKIMYISVLIMCIGKVTSNRLVIFNILASGSVGCEVGETSDPFSQWEGGGAFSNDEQPRNRVTNDSPSLVAVGIKTENQLSSIDIPVSEMMGLSVVFVEETHTLRAIILYALDKIKQLNVSKKSFLRDFLAQLEDFVDW